MHGSTQTRRQEAIAIEHFLQAVLTGQRLSVDELLTGINLIRTDALSANPIISGRLSRAAPPGKSLNAIILTAKERAA